jgi:hypothetical protein
LAPDVPLPSATPPLRGMREPKLSLHEPGSVELIRNQPVAAAPFGFVVALSCAELLVSSVGAFVVTDGLSFVVNESTVPIDVPSEFCAMTQK